MDHPYAARSFAKPPIKKNMLTSQNQFSSHTNTSSPLVISIPYSNTPTNDKNLSSSFPSATLTPPSLNRKSHFERQRSKFDLLFNGTNSSPTTPTIFNDMETTPSGDLMSPSAPLPDSHPLLQSCYATIANLRVDVDRWQTRCREAQSRAQASEESSFSITTERNVLQQRLLEAEQENNTYKSRATSLNGEVDSLDIEIDKLRRENHRLRKMAYRQEESDLRISELETLLNESHRQTKAADSRFHKLQSQHDTLKKAHRKLQQSSQRGGADAEVYEKVAWLRESNDKLRTALSEVTSMTASPDAIQHQATTLVGVVNQLIDANGRLKTELLGYCDLISDYKAENKHMRDQVRNLSPPSCLAPVDSHSFHNSVRPRVRRRSSADRPYTMPDSEYHNHPTLLEELSQIETPKNSSLNKSRSTMLSSVKPDKFKGFTMKRPSGIFTTTIPMQHLYQDNWMSATDDSEVEESYSRMLTPVPGNHRRQISVTSSIMSEVDIQSRPKHSQSKERPQSTFEPSNGTLQVPSPRHRHRHSFANTITNTHSTPKLPISTLVEVTVELLDRLQASEPKLLNRKLQRSFDLLRLAPISNEVINNIQQNISLLPTRFSYLRSTSSSPKPTHNRTHSQPIELLNSHTYTQSANPCIIKSTEWETTESKHFLALVSLVQKLLNEIAETRLNFNHLSMAYVDKVAHLAEDQIIKPDIRSWPQLLLLRRSDTDKNHETKSLLSSLSSTSSQIETTKMPFPSTRHRRTTSSPDNLVRRSMAPMQIRNGVMNYSPQQTLNINPVISSVTSTVSENVSSIDTLRRLANSEQLSPTCPIPALIPTSLQTQPIVSVDATETHRAAVICHTYSLLGYNSSPPSLFSDP